MISFQFKFTTGQSYEMYENQNKIFLSVLQNFVVNVCPKNVKIKQALTSGAKVKMLKTLLENKIVNGSVVMIVVEVFNLSNYTKKGFTIYPEIQEKPVYQNSQKNLNIFNPIMNYNNNINKVNTFPNNNNFLNPLSEIIKQNEILIKCKNFLMNRCNIPKEMLDEDGDCVDNDWRVGKKNGPPEYLKEYSPPLGWIGIGLKVSGLYDNGDNTWLSSVTQKGEWYIAYHPIKTIDSIIGILNNGFRRGVFQNYKNAYNINPLTNALYHKCGEGVYFIPDINETKKYTKVIDYLGNKFRIAFMCRINPYAVRIANIGKNKESWIVNGDLLNDPFGMKRDKEVRPYRIILFMEN